jgi:predicted nucleic acid-binding protein
LANTRSARREPATAGGEAARPVLTEVRAPPARRIHNQAALEFLTWVERGGLRLDAAGPASLPSDPADASVAEAAARPGVDAVLSIDADFDLYRDSRGRLPRNLLRLGA